MWVSLAYRAGEHTYDMDMFWMDIMYRFKGKKGKLLFVILTYIVGWTWGAWIAIGKTKQNKQKTLFLFSPHFSLFFCNNVL